MRKADVTRKTSETEVAVEIDLDGTGRSQIDTSVPFFDHMLDLLARHSLADLSIQSRGDTAVDDHHLVEDVGICLGQAVRKALGERRGINRYGDSLVPMDESLCSAAVDLSGRPCLVWNASLGACRIGQFDPQLLREFFKAFCDHGGITLHVNLLYGTNEHHMAEAVFKAFARAFREAVARSGRPDDIPSTKGSLDT